MIPAGLGLLTIAMCGKTATRFYKSVQTGNAFNQSEAILGAYYKGGFQDTMNRREAAMILGVRESTEMDKIMKAHRKLMFMNHPDNGGSTHLATKINEAKEILLQGSGGK